MAHRMVEVATEDINKAAIDVRDLTIAVEEEEMIETKALRMGDKTTHSWNVNQEIAMKVATVIAINKETEETEEIEEVTEEVTEEAEEVEVDTKIAETRVTEITSSRSVQTTGGELLSKSFEWFL